MIDCDAIFKKENNIMLNDKQKIIYLVLTFAVCDECAAITYEFEFSKSLAFVDEEWMIRETNNVQAAM